MQGRLSFGPFVLDPAERLLLRNGEPVELGGRYLDALLLLAAEPGRLVTKDRFHQEVWRGIPVTDEALTQCIRTLRRQLGDAAASPRYIETVPKHGYRFVAPVEPERAEEGEPAHGTPGPHHTTPPASAAPAPLHPLLLALAGTLGGGVAGLLGGLVYGSLGTSQPLAPGMSGGMGATSVLFVLMALTAVIGLAGGAGVSLGLAAAHLARPRPGLWWIAGAAAGGLLIGGGAELLGLDAFNLLLGEAPADITGAGEGALIGAGVGLGAWLALRRPRPMPRAIALAALAGALAGTLVPLMGGRLLAGSLDLLASDLPGSRLRLDRIGALLGEDGFGPLSQLVTSAFEGGLFTAGVVGAMLLARRWRAGFHQD